jgi:RNA polymerase sigma-70 factor (ECF subfamily)
MRDRWERVTMKGWCRRGTPVEEADVSFADALPGAAVWEPPAWEQVVREHRSRVYRLALRLTGNRHDAEDLTQETFVRVFRSLSTYRPGSFEGWLHRITTNAFLDQMRRRSRHRTQPFDPDFQLPATGADPAQLLNDASLSFDVRAALIALPPQFREAVVLCDVDGHTYEEISAMLGVKMGTVRSRIHRGRSLLRASLAHRAPLPDAPGRRKSTTT